MNTEHHNVPKVTHKYITLQKIRVFEEKLNNYTLKLGQTFYEEYTNKSYDEYYKAAYNIYFAKEIELIRKEMREIIEKRIVNGEINFNNLNI